MKINTTIQGDCLYKLKEFKDNFVDSIITDPPYELGFMGKSWDSTGIAYNVEMWKECLRVLKPGGHLLSFGGTRTYHRMAVAIEDAGFEIRDMIEWVYGSGFPKSLNIGKAVDKIQGNEREVVGEQKLQGTAATLKGKANRENWYDQGAGGTYTPEIEITKGTSEWKNWGTALKPAHEPIVMARKPLSEKTVAENVLKWGTGGIDIDGSRVGNNGGETHKGGFGSGIYGDSNGVETDKSKTQGRFPSNLLHDNSEAVRECFPETGNNARKNKVGEKSTFAFGQPTKYTNVEWNITDSGNASRFFKSIIYQPKASKSERNKGCERLENEKFTAGNYSQSPVCKTCNKTLNGTNNHSKCSGEVYYKEMDSKNTKNNHPTVKPIALMEYLIKMITPKGGVVLDPFFGSGSTGLACINTKRNWIGIELDKNYCEIANKRIEAGLAQQTLF